MGTSPLFSSTSRLKIEKSKFAFSFQSIVKKFDYSGFHVRESYFSHMLQTPLSLNERKYTLLNELIHVQNSPNKDSIQVINCVFSEMTLNSAAIFISADISVTVTANSFHEITSRQNSIVSLRDRTSSISHNCFVNIYSGWYMVDAKSGEKLHATFNTFQNCSKSIFTTSQKFSYLQNMNITNSVAEVVAENTDLLTFACTLSHFTYSIAFESDFSYLAHLKRNGHNLISSINLIKTTKKGKLQSSVIISDINEVVVSNSYIMNTFGPDNSTCLEGNSIFFINCYFYITPNTHYYPITGDYIVANRVLSKEMNMLNTFNCLADSPSQEPGAVKKLNEMFAPYPKKTLIGLIIGPIIGICMYICLYKSLRPLKRQSRRKLEYLKSKQFAKGVTLLK